MEARISSTIQKQVHFPPPFALNFAHSEVDQLFEDMVRHCSSARASVTKFPFNKQKQG
jgi:hypothetical protein